MDAGVQFSELQVQTRNGLRRVCVVTPTRDLLLSRERLEQLRAGQTETELDRFMVEYLGQGEPYHALVFRGTNDDATARYGLDDTLDAQEEGELVTQLLRAHLRFFQQIEPLGVRSMVGVGFRDADQLAYVRAADRLADQLASELLQAEGVRAEKIKLEQWLLERQATWTAAPFEAFVETKLAAAVVAAERQHRRLQQMLVQAGG